MPKFHSPENPLHSTILYDISCNRYFLKSLRMFFHFYKVSTFPSLHCQPRAHFSSPLRLCELLGEATSYSTVIPIENQFHVCSCASLKSPCSLHIDQVPRRALHCPGSNEGTNIDPPDTQVRCARSLSFPPFLSFLSFLPPTNPLPISPQIFQILRPLSPSSQLLSILSFYLNHHNCFSVQDPPPTSPP